MGIKQYVVDASKINYCFDARDLELVASNALGIEAASFWSAAEKDIAESPTASPERPNRRQQSTRPQDYKF
ncbi:MAG: hypothetical protein J6Q39_06915 [Bacteroidales bacterium]|nr:hypothetical protein [Bacteroidales bacterium]